MICLYTVRQTFSFLDYHFLHDKAQLPLNLYAERISKYLISSNNTRSSDNSKMFTCKHCMKQFRHSGSLAQHVRMHTNIENFRCPICFKLFSRIYDMKTHVKCRHPEYVDALSSWFYLVPVNCTSVDIIFCIVLNLAHLVLFIITMFLDRFFKTTLLVLQVDSDSQKCRVSWLGKLKER